MEEKTSREKSREKIFKSEDKGETSREAIKKGNTYLQKHFEGLLETYQMILLFVELTKKEENSMKFLLKLEKETDVFDELDLKGYGNATKEEINKLFINCSVEKILDLPLGELPTEEEELKLVLEIRVIEMWKRYRKQKSLGIGAIGEYTLNSTRGPEKLYLEGEERIEDYNCRFDIAQQEFKEYLNRLESQDAILWQVAVYRGIIKTFRGKNDQATRRARKRLKGDYEEFVKYFKILKSLIREGQALALELTSSEVSHRVYPK